MLALIDKTDKKPGFPRGPTGAGGVTVRRISVLRMPCVHITLAAAQNIGTASEQLKAAVRIMRRAGIDTVCFKHGFPYAEYFKTAGFTEAGLAELFEAMAEQAAGRLSRPCAAAYFYAPRLSSAASRTLLVLCRANRLVMADVNGGVHAFSALRRNLGVSIVERPPASMLAAAAEAFFLGVPRFEIALPDSCVVYAADKSALYASNAARYVSALDAALPEDMERLLPDGFPRALLINEALRITALHRDSLTLRGLTISGREHGGDYDFTAS